MNRPLALIGPPGAGKTTIGRAAASALGWEFLDLDEQVAASAHRSVGEIFAEEGEGSFREYESRALLASLAKGRTVVACGGGVVLSEKNVELMRERATVVYLETPVEVVLERLNDGGAHHRPLLAGLPSDGVSMLIRARLPLYQKAADLTVDASRPEEEVVRDIVEAAVR